MVTGDVDFWEMVLRDEADQPTLIEAIDLLAFCDAVIDRLTGPLRRMRVRRLFYGRLRCVASPPTTNGILNILASAIAAADMSTEAAR